MCKKSIDRLQISIFGLWRDAEKHIDKTLKQLEALEKKHDLSYYFYENDSTDNTVSILKKWMKTRKGKFSSDKLGDDFFTNMDIGSRLEERMFKMAHYRNLMLNLGKNTETDWSVVLDTDIEFNDTIIEDLLSYSKKDIAMITPCIEQTIECKMCVPPCKKLSYYDSWALRTEETPMRSLTFSCNPFWEEHNRKRYKEGKPVEVNCAFGGFALIRTKSLLQSKWDTTGDCEHIMFAADVRKTGKIIVCPKVKVYTYVEESKVNIQPEFLIWQKTILEDIWARKAAMIGASFS